MSNHNLYVFNHDKLNKQIEQVKQTYYTISADISLPPHYEYCLTKHNHNKHEILLCKTIKDKELFQEVVDNLSEYFNATIIYETN